MKVLTRYRRLAPTTLTGEQIEVVTTYSSFNKEEIDALEKTFKEIIGTVAISERQEQEHEHK